jgi:lipoate-protein ligase A
MSVSAQRDDTPILRYLNPRFTQATHLLAFEEALLDLGEAQGSSGFLAFWEAPDYFVVLGYGKMAEKEVVTVNAEKRGIAMLRRCSGGGTVLQGPGCLNYTLVLPQSFHVLLETISGANQFIMNRQLRAVRTLVSAPESVQAQGCTDLTFDGLKFSGNAQRRKRTHLLFHGSFLFDFDLELVEQILKMPAQQPDYRQGRTHREFIRNLPVAKAELMRAVRLAWNAPEEAEIDLPKELSARTEQLVAEKYSCDEWNLKF